MIEVVAPLGLVAVAAIVVAILMRARRQGAARRSVFLDFAEMTGRRYLETDDGTAETLGGGFEGFGHFSSSSLGNTPASPVVIGRIGPDTICHFQHGIRRTEGDARLWTVCIIETREVLCDVPVRIRPREALGVIQIGGDQKVSFPDDDEFDQRFEVRSRNPTLARECVGREVRSMLSTHGSKLPLPVGVQIRDRRVAAALARRNDEVTEVGDLLALDALARDLAGILI